MSGKNKSATEAQRERTARMRAKFGAKPVASDAGATVDPADVVLVGVHSFEEKRSAPPETWFRCCKCERVYQRKDVIEAANGDSPSFSIDLGYLDARHQAQRLRDALDTCTADILSSNDRDGRGGLP